MKLGTKRRRGRPLPGGGVTMPVENLEHVVEPGWLAYHFAYLLLLGLSRDLCLGAEKILGGFLLLSVLGLKLIFRTFSLISGKLILGKSSLERALIQIAYVYV